MQKNIPKLRFPEFKDEWEEKKLGDISDVRDGTHDSPSYHYNGIPLITSKNLNNDGSIDLKNVNLVSIQDFNNINKRSKVDVGDILFGMIGTIGNPVIVINNNFAIKNVALIKERQRIQNKYLYQYLRSSYIEKKFHQKNAGGTQKFIALGLIRDLKIPTPLVVEQQKITEFLTSTDNWIQNLKKQKENLEMYKKAIMQKIFSQEIIFKDEKGKDYPKWEEMKLGEISFVTTGSSNRQDSTTEGKYTFFDRSVDIRASSQYLFDGEALIVAGEGQEFVPRYFVGKFDLHQRTYAIMNFKYSVGKFIFYYIYQNRRYFNKVSVGSTVPSLRLPMFNKMTILLPNIQEQQKIADFLTSVDKVIESKQQQIALAESWKKGLMQRMFI